MKRNDLLDIRYIVTYATCVFVSERKLQPMEFPHNIYIQNYSTATATCIALKRWLFTVSRETMMNSDETAVNFLFGEVTSYACIGLALALT